MSSIGIAFVLAVIVALSLISFWRQVLFLTVIVFFTLMFVGTFTVMGVVHT